MRFVRRQHEELILVHLVFLAADLVESAAVYAVDEHILIDAVLAYTVVVFSLGIIAYIGYEETPAEVVSFLHLNYHPGQYYRPLALETVFLANHDP